MLVDNILILSSFILIFIMTFVYIFKKLTNSLLDFQKIQKKQIEQNIEVYISAVYEMHNTKSQIIKNDFQKISSDQIRQLDASRAINHNLKELIIKIEKFNFNIDKRIELENEIIKLKKILNRKKNNKRN